VRPTSASITPQELEGKIDADQLKLYALIWKRAVACQMAHAVFDTVAVDLLAGPRGPAPHAARQWLHAGEAGLHRRVPGRPDEERRPTTRRTMLPAMQEGDLVKLIGLHGEQHFTEPPPRFSEASLVKALEEYGIGRPSTYAPRSSPRCATAST
jgi:DNA topoisomerase-1